MPSLLSSRSVAFSFAFVSLLAFGAGCRKADEVKQEAPAPTETSVAISNGQSGQPQLQVKAGANDVRINSGTLPPPGTVKVTGNPAAPPAPQAAAPAAQPAAIAAQNGKKPVILRADDGREVKIGENGVELNAADGRRVHVGENGAIAEDANRARAKVKVGGGTVQAGGVRVEGDKVFVPGLGTVSGN